MIAKLCVVFSFLIAFPLAVTAQTPQRGPVFPGGGNEFILRSSPVEFFNLLPEGARKPLGEAFAEAISENGMGAVLETDYLCDAALSELPGSFLAGVAEVGAFLGLCQSPSDEISKILPTFHAEVKSFCESFTSLETVIGECRGKPVRGLKMTNCSYSPPNIEPSCSGIRQWCMSTEAWVGINHPSRGGDPQGLLGRFNLPGCTCQIRHYWEAQCSLNFNIQELSRDSG